MRRRYTHSNSIKPFRIRNRFSHDSRNEALPDNIFNNVLSEDVNMKDINHGDNDNNELILLEDGVITESSDDDNEEESSGEEEDNNDKKKGSSYEEKGNNDEEEGNNNEDDCNNDEEEHNYDEEKGDGNEEKAIHQIVKTLDEDKISSCNGEFAPYLDNYTTTTLFCWLQKHNVSTKAYEDL
ncbi:hypothetical protein RhiirB3_458124, partial [Rhizophagus irregularis]